MKRRGFSRLTGFVLTLVMIISTMTQGFTLRVYANENKSYLKNIPGKVVYHRDNEGTAIGYDQITIDGINYYDAVDNAKDVELDIGTLETIFSKKGQDIKKNLFEKWGVIAKGMINDLGDRYSCSNVNDGFWSSFASGKSSNVNIDDVANENIDDIAKVLGSPQANEGLRDNKAQGEPGRDYATSTDIFRINSLNGLRERMASEIAKANKWDIPKADFLDEGPDIQSGIDMENETDTTGAKGNALQDLKSVEDTMGFGKIVTCLSQEGKTAKYFYSSFGLAFYDFDIVPLVGGDIKLIDDFEKYAKLDDPEAIDQHLRSNHHAVVTGKVPDSEKTPTLFMNKTDSPITTKLKYKVKNKASVTNQFKDSKKYKFGITVNASGTWITKAAEFNWWREWTTSADKSQQAFEEWAADEGKNERDSEVEIEFKASFSHSESEKTSVKKSSDHSGQVKVKLPAHTGVVNSYSTSANSLSYDYQCPVAITYKVAIFGMSGEMYSDGRLTNYLNTAGYNHSYFSMILGSKYNRYGETANENLHYRLTKAVDDIKSDSSYGKTDCWTDKGGVPSKNWIDWDNVAKKITNGSRDQLDDYTRYVPMVASGGGLDDRNEIDYMEVEPIQPLYPLARVSLNQDKEFLTLKEGEQCRLSNINLKGYDASHTAYYGFSADSGHWVICDSDKKTLEASDRIELTDSPNGYQVLSGKSGGRAYLKWVLDDDVTLKSVTGTPITAANFEEKVNTPQITVDVQGTSTVGADELKIIQKKTEEVTSTGNMNDFLKTESKKGEYTVCSNIIWQKGSEYDDDNKYTLQEDGEIHFKEPGTYSIHAKEKYPRGDGKYADDLCDVSAGKVELSEGCNFLDDEGNVIEDNVFAGGDGVRIRSGSSEFVGFMATYPDGEQEILLSKKESEGNTAFFIMPEIAKNQTLKITELTSAVIDKEIYGEDDDDQWDCQIPDKDMQEMYIGNKFHQNPEFNLKDWVKNYGYDDEIWDSYTSDMRFSIEKITEEDLEVDDPSSDQIPASDTDYNEVELEPDNENQSLIEDDEEEIVENVDGASISQNSKLNINKPGNYLVTAIITRSQGAENVKLDKKSVFFTVDELIIDEKTEEEVVKETIEGKPDKVSLKLDDNRDVVVEWQGSSECDGYYIEYSDNETFINEKDQEEEPQHLKIDDGLKAVITRDKLGTDKQWYVRVYAYQIKDGVEIFGESSPAVPIDLERMEVEKAILDIPSPIASLTDSKEAVEKILESFDKLTEDQRKQVAKEAVTKAADIKAVLKTVDAIEAIKGEDAADLNVIEASKAYEALSETQLGILSEDDRATLEETLSKQESRVAERNAAKAKELIEKLPDEAGIKDKEQVAAARAAFDLYEKMSSRMKKTVKGFAAETLKQKLEAAEAKIKAAEEALKQKPAREPGKVVKVSKIRLTGISKRIAAGKKIKLKATVLPANASNKKLKWTSSNRKIATVTQTGLVKVKKKTGAKSVKIFAASTDGSKVKAVWIIKSMKGRVKSIRIKGAKKTLKAGKTMKLKAIVKATKGANKKIKWVSSNKKYATVTSSGMVKAIKTARGKTVRITAKATDGTNKKIVCKIKIR